MKMFAKRKGEPHCPRGIFFAGNKSVEIFVYVKICYVE